MMMKHKMFKLFCTNALARVSGKNRISPGVEVIDSSVNHPL